MKFTGERMIGLTPEEVIACHNEGKNHVDRYTWACGKIRCGDILDLATGTGYGAFMMAKVPGTASVLGVDIDKDTIDYCTQRHPNLKFEQGDMLVGDFGKFDSIVSFETIEHCKNPEIVLKNFVSMLKPGGNILVSCPIVKSIHMNKYHLWEVDGFDAAIKFFENNGFKVLDTMNQQGIYSCFELVHDIS